MATLTADDKLTMSLEDIAAARRKEKPAARPSRASAAASRASRRAAPAGGSGGRAGKGRGGAGGGAGTRVYVHNLSWDVDWRDLKDHFRTVGEVLHADVLRRSDNKSKGCGIVEYANAADAKRAIEELHDSDIKGRAILVREDREGPSATAGNRARSGSTTAPAAKRRGAGVRVWVGNLPFDVDWPQLKDTFAECGDVAFADVPKSADGRSRGYGIVEFTSAAGARRCIEVFDGKVMDGRRIEVREDRDGRTAGGAGGRARGAGGSDGGGGGDGPVGQRVFVGNLSYETDWAALKDHMRTAGSVLHADIARQNDGRSKGYGIVEFASVSDARNAIRELHDSYLGGRQIIVRPNKNQKGPAGCRLYVGNLPYRMSWQSLKDLFADVGEVAHADVPVGADGRSKGFGIVEMATAEDAQAAIRALNDESVEGRSIEVRLDRDA